MSFKERFPNEIVLKKVINDSWGDLTSTLKKELDSKHEAFQVARWQVWQWIAVLMGEGVFVFSISSWVGFVDMLPPVLEVIASIGILAGLIVLAVIALWRIGEASEAISAFNNALDTHIFKHTFNVFGLTIEQKNNYDIMSVLNASELVTEPHNSNQRDDTIITQIDGQELTVSELNLQHETGSGKNRHVKKIFHGYFCALALPKTLSGKTFISTEGDEKGFGHRSFWSNKGVEETELEWNDFENLLHVASTDPTEARYILTTDFMQDLYDWWQHKKTNIRISFIDNRMYIFFPDKQVRLGRTVAKLETYELQQYVMTIATPLMHVLHLVEDVRV